MGRLRHYNPDETVLDEGDRVTFVGVVLSGVLRVQKTIEDGRMQIVDLLLPSDLFGGTLAQRSYVAIEAATETTLCLYHRSDIEGLMKRFPGIERKILLFQIEELRRAQEWILLLGCQSIRERVATFFQTLLERGQGCSDPHDPRSELRVRVPIGRRDMAAYLGTTVESISRCIHEIAHAGAIRIVDAQEFVILDGALLARLAGRSADGSD